MTYRFADCYKDNVQSEIDRYAGMGWKVISISAYGPTGSYVYIVFGRD